MHSPDTFTPGDQKHPAWSVASGIPLSEYLKFPGGKLRDRTGDNAGGRSEGTAGIKLRFADRNFLNMCMTVSEMCQIGKGKAREMAFPE